MQHLPYTHHMHGIIWATLNLNPVVCLCIGGIGATWSQHLVHIRRSIRRSLICVVQFCAKRCRICRCTLSRIGATFVSQETGRGKLFLGLHGESLSYEVAGGVRHSVTGFQESYGLESK